MPFFNAANLVHAMILGCRWQTCHYCDGDAFGSEADVGHAWRGVPNERARTIQRRPWPTSSSRQRNGLGARGRAQVVQRAWVRAVLGGDQTFHGLRHDFASLLARLGVPLRVAMDMLGHSQELMTIYYQHASDADRREAADKVGAWLRDTVGRWARA